MEETKLFTCRSCQKEIPAYEPKFAVELKHIDIPVSHLIFCKECAEKVEKHNAS